MKQRHSRDTIKAIAENLLTVNEAIRALGVSRSTLWRRLQSGAIPSVRRGGRRLVCLTMTRKATRGEITGDIPPFTGKHAIFRLMGAGRSGGRTPGVRDKHAILDA